MLVFSCSWHKGNWEMISTLDASQTEFFNRAAHTVTSLKEFGNKYSQFYGDTDKQHND